MGRRPGERGGGSDKGILLASPSHLFFPLRQAVQARAPRFGMCAGVVGDGGDSPAPVGDSSAPLLAAAVEMLCVRRRLAALPPESADVEDGDIDIALIVLAVADVFGGAALLRPFRAVS